MRYQDGGKEIKMEDKKSRWRIRNQDGGYKIKMEDVTGRLR